MGTAERTGKEQLRRVVRRLRLQKEEPGVKPLSGTG